MKLDEALAVMPKAYEYGPITKQEIERYIPDPHWQQWRKDMKGTSTYRKIEMLAIWFNRMPTRMRQVQVTNYLNALKRGGQLK